MARTPRLIYEYQHIYRPGLTNRAAAEELGCTEGHIAVLRRQLGLTTKPGINRADPAKLERARQLLEDGAPLKEAERTTGLDWRTIRRHFPEHRGWTYTQAGEYARQLDKLKKL
ncbi:helix-turn-helix DNA-binding domain protein [Arthrobacter phage Leona]|nr:helix-turn-helix DNA-binding domain protein [Arthrobacter phage Leona]